MELAEYHPISNWWISKVHIQISELHMCVSPGPTSQDAVFKCTYALPGLQCTLVMDWYVLRGLATINPLSTVIYSIGQKKGIMAKKFMVFQRFLAVVYSVAIDVWAVESATWTLHPSSLCPLWHFDPIRTSTVTFCPCDNMTYWLCLTQS